MREKLKALAELQKVDLEVASLRKAADVHPRQISDLERELGVARNGIEAERTRVADLEKQKALLEQNITDEKDKVKKWEARLSDQRSTREYSALAREIDIAKKGILTQSEALTEKVKELGGAREAIKGKEAEYATKLQGLSGRMTELRGKLGESDSQVKELEGRRADVAANVDSNLLRRYEVIRKKKLPAMVGVVAGTCQGCNMNLPPQMYNALRTSLGTDVCPSCNRIIFAIEAFDKAPDSAAK
ncbi:C4-type zinc ribbon domain-containing protein [Corallococcus sp. bb12-1]|uniref:zinc ribbon domain-containing protein n=1 Tax=Corallococcus sp. bb12-1 TaxID=2996784 RepID=UPI00226E5855|nr:C4-type zinc ribbon domain-containing protein [Corallococcus sp. bb12-1]MCY1042508.1 C4-type zinc ribbon domain-containing protein [Corallococcus sp. bb12-1]